MRPGRSPSSGSSSGAAKSYAVIIPNARTETLLPIIESKIKPDSIVYTDSFKAYDVLDVSDFHHVRINHSQLFAEDRNHINGIENFWNQAKRSSPALQRHPKASLPPLSQGVRMALQLPPNRQPLEGLTAMGKYVITSSLAVSAP